MSSAPYFFFFFFNDTATTEIYTLSLHDALPISVEHRPDHIRVPIGEHRAVGLTQVAGQEPQQGPAYGAVARLGRERPRQSDSAQQAGADETRRIVPHTGGRRARACSRVHEQIEGAARDGEIGSVLPPGGRRVQQRRRLRLHPAPTDAPGPAPRG